MNLSLRKVFTSLAVVFSWQSFALAQLEPVHEIQQIQTSITLDGFSDEAAWQGIVPLPLTMGAPVFRGAMTEKTEIRLAYDEDYLYISARCFDSVPNKIISTTLSRDGMSPSDDSFGVLIDSFNDNQTGVLFVINSVGARSDLSVANDGEAGGGHFPGQMSWNTFWDAEAKTDDRGWFAEMRIPFSSLRFQASDGAVTMGISTFRYLPRKNETATFPEMPPRYNWGFLKSSLTHKFKFHGIRPRRPVYVTPYALGGIEMINELNDSESAYAAQDKSARDIGLDLKYGITSNMTLDLTYNTDFAQVEADDQQINLTRFSLFFPEKRLFFQERSSAFEFNLGGPNRVFHSRRIGLESEGTVPLLGGGRLVGRIGDWDVGILTMQTKATELEDSDGLPLDIPTENFGVVRLKREVLNENSTIGGILTSRTGGTDNYVYGIDGLFNVKSDDFVEVAWASSIEEGVNSNTILDASKIRLNIDRRSSEGFSYDIGLSRVGPDYNPGIGYESRSDYTRIGDAISYTWRPGGESKVYQDEIEFDFRAYLRNSDGGLESAEYGPAWSHSTKVGSNSRIWTKVMIESLSETLDLPNDTQVPAGDYQFYDIGGYYNLPQGHRFAAGMFATGGPWYDGWAVTVGMGPQFSFSERLKLSGNYRLTSAWFDKRNQSFNAHLLSLRVNAAWSKALTASALVQYNGTSDLVGLNLRLRYNPREGTDLFIVYNSGINLDRKREYPVLPTTSDRTVMVKYSITYLR